ncbi:hypothetical protein ACSAZK_04250 [Methanosarcina sp. Mfa9]|uniref:hypothetical protein n=1 Tax=Methanosarcina sp. Mfa9 TaxID=3439063 RepID=UPI003F8426E9
MQKKYEKMQEYTGKCRKNTRKRRKTQEDAGIHRKMQKKYKKTQENTRRCRNTQEKRGEKCG